MNQELKILLSETTTGRIIRNMTDSGKDKPRLSRGDFIKLVGAGALAIESLAACGPKSTSTVTPESNPTFAAPTEMVVSTETPMPDVLQSNFLPAEISGYSKNEVLKAVSAFDANEINWYDSQGNLQTAKGRESGFVLVGGFGVSDKQGRLPNGNFGIVTSNGGQKHFAQQFTDGRWMVLSHIELARPTDGHIFESYAYSSKGKTIPVLSVEKDEKGQYTGNSFYYEKEMDEFFKIENPIPEGGMAGLARVALTGFEHISAAQLIMEQSQIQNWNFAWSKDGTLQIVSEGKVLYHRWNEKKGMWVSEQPKVIETNRPAINEYWAKTFYDLNEGTSYMEKIASNYDEFKAYLEQNNNTLPAMPGEMLKMFYLDSESTGISKIIPMDKPYKMDLVITYVSLDTQPDYIIPNGQTYPNWSVIDQDANGKSVSIGTVTQSYDTYHQTEVVIVRRDSSIDLEGRPITTNTDIISQTNKLSRTYMYYLWSLVNTDKSIGANVKKLSSWGIPLDTEPGRMKFGSFYLFLKNVGTQYQDSDIQSQLPPLIFQ